MDDELDRFKREIDLRAYAAGQGYAQDRKNSYRGSTCMRHPGSDDKLFMKLNDNGHYIYFSVRDPKDNGTIIDFVQNRQRVSIGVVRKELRPWIGQPPVPVPVFPALPKTPKDRLKVETEYAKMRELARHPYLEHDRGIPASVLESERFAGLVRADDRQNAIFGHFDQRGLCGYEIKNRPAFSGGDTFTGFASGGTKGLCESQERDGDNRLVFTESAIEFYSHAALFPDERTRYKSIGGKPNPLQPELIKTAILAMPAGSETVSAMNNDADGAALAHVVRLAVQAAQAAGHDVRFVLQEPLGFKDWNNQLRGVKPAASFPIARSSLAHDLG